MTIPRRLSYRPTWKGLPVPFVVSWTGDKPDFRVTNHDKWFEAVSKRLCGVCGNGLGVDIHFIGGPVSVETKTFYDPPMHRECAEYALANCPFLAKGRDYRGDHPRLIQTNAPKPTKVALVRAANYRLVQVGKFTYIRASKARVISWHDTEPADSDPGVRPQVLDVHGLGRATAVSSRNDPQVL